MYIENNRHWKMDADCELKEIKYCLSLNAGGVGVTVGGEQTLVE